MRSLRQLGLVGLVARRVGIAVRQVGRIAAWNLSPNEWPSARTADSSARTFPHRVYERSHLIARNDASVHPRLEQGKRVNVALAAPYFDGILVTATSPLSFWRTLGPVTAARGYDYGMELRGGCIALGQSFGMDFEGSLGCQSLVQAPFEKGHALAA